MPISRRNTGLELRAPGCTWLVDLYFCKMVNDTGPAGEKSKTEKNQRPMAGWLVPVQSSSVYWNRESSTYREEYNVEVADAVDDDHVDEVTGDNKFISRQLARAALLEFLYDINRIYGDDESVEK